jgi:hypothetical protein
VAGCCEHGNEPSFSIKYKEVSSPAEELLASQKGLSSLELFVYVKFEVLSAVTVNSTVLWNVTPCSTTEVRRCFGVTYYLHLQCLSTTMEVEI